MTSTFNSSQSKVVIKFEGLRQASKNSRTKESFSVIINGSRGFLQYHTYMYLITLALARTNEFAYSITKGWCLHSGMIASDNTTRYVWKIRNDLRAQGMSIEIECNNRGSYRLAGDHLTITYNDYRLTEVIEVYSLRKALGYE